MSAAPGTDALERRFGVRAAASTVQRELLAGLTTYLTLCYVVFVHPAVMQQAGMPSDGVLFATCIASALACFVMALAANYPIALAPAMGHNFFFAFAVCGSMGLAWQEALAANLLAGGAFLLLAATPLRESVMHAIPAPLKLALAAGIGLLIAILGLRWGKLITDDPATLIRMGDLGDPVALLTLFGLALTAALLALRWRAAILLGLLGSVAAGWLATRLWSLDPPLVEWAGILGAPPSPADTAFALDFGGLFAHPVTTWLSVVLTFWILDLFDTAGTLIGVAQRAGLLVDGKLPRARAAFTADATGTVTGALLGTSTITSYVESAAGVSAGGRTGLVAAVVGVCMLLSLFLTPLVTMVGAGVPDAAVPGARYYPVLAPVMMLVGALMVGAVADVDWREPADAIPAFLTLVMIPLTLSITDGLAWGMIAYSLLGLVRRRTVHPLVHAIALLFILRYTLE